MIIYFIFFIVVLVAVVWMWRRHDEQILVDRCENFCVDQEEVEEREKHD